MKRLLQLTALTILIAAAALFGACADGSDNQTEESDSVKYAISYEVSDTSATYVTVDGPASAAAKETVTFRVSAPSGAAIVKIEFFDSEDGECVKSSVLDGLEGEQEFSFTMADYDIRVVIYVEMAAV